MSEVPTLPVPAPGHALQPAGLPPAALVEIAALALRLDRANGPVIRALNAVGGHIEARMAALPAGVRGAVEKGTGELLERAYMAAGFVGSLPMLPDTGNWGHRVAAATGGAVGGFGGLASALVELPATIGLFFSAMQKVAGEYGFDPKAEETRLACLSVFGSGGPLDDDDGVNTSFLGARLSLNGTTLTTLIQRVAPSLAAVLGRKLASQTVPVLGAVAGAGVNVAYLGYYRDMAHVRFGLMRLAESHPEEAVLAEFRAAVRNCRGAADPG
ncbi:MAG: EcsC family protein [Paracoccaceae bacterium]